jgi:hypothetical protein
MNNIVICIGTIGSPTFDKCKRSVDKIAKNNPLIKDVVIIRDKKPQSEWLNTMRLAALDAEWCLQVDEDMYLYDNCINILYQKAVEEKNKGKKILNVSSFLYDLFLETKIGSLKLWSTDVFRILDFRDVLGGDRDYARRAHELGYRNISIKNILGDHDSAPTPSIAFKKYFEYTQKIRKFSGDEEAIKFNLSLKLKYDRKKDYITKKALDGSSMALVKRIKDISKR